MQKMFISYLTIHSPVFSQSDGVSIPVMLATDNAQYAPLMSISPPTCIAKEPSDCFMLYRNSNNVFL